MNLSLYFYKVESFAYIFVLIVCVYLRLYSFCGGLRNHMHFETGGSRSSKI